MAPRANTSSLELPSDLLLLSAKSANRSSSTSRPSSSGQSSSLPTELSSPPEVSTDSQTRSLHFQSLILYLAIHHASQKRPRSRTLKAVQNAILDDIVQPSSVTGRTTRVAINGKRTETIFLDPLDESSISERLDAMAHAYAKLTTHAVVFAFSKPTSFQQKKLDALKKK